jgi:hypothetical protein
MAQTTCNKTLMTMQDKTLEPSSISTSYPRLRGSQNQRQPVPDEVEIQRRVNYDDDNGAPDPLDANNPIQAAELCEMHDINELQCLA